MRVRRVESWVVYRTVLKGQATGINAVCEAAEWEVMQAAQPGAVTLIRAGIMNEGEAERLARETAVVPVQREAEAASSPTLAS